MFQTAITHTIAAKETSQVATRGQVNSFPFSLFKPVAVGAANACLFVSSTRRRPNALSRDRHDSVMHRSSTLRGAPQLHHVKRRIANCLSCTSRMFHFFERIRVCHGLVFCTMICLLYYNFFSHNFNATLHVFRGSHLATIRQFVL
jgi:hypothetical protein